MWGGGGVEGPRFEGSPLCGSEGSHTLGSMLYLHTPTPLPPLPPLSQLPALPASQSSQPRQSIASPAPTTPLTTVLTADCYPGSGGRGDTLALCQAGQLGTVTLLTQCRGYPRARALEREPYRLHKASPIEYLPTDSQTLMCLKPSLSIEGY